jgi:hypothetical protein
LKDQKKFKPKALKDEKEPIEREIVDKEPIENLEEQLRNERHKSELREEQHKNEILQLKSKVSELEYKLRILELENEVKLITY